MRSLEAVAIYGLILVFGALGWITRRAAIALVPLLALIVFQAVMLSSDERYGQVGEDTQMALSFGLAMSAVATLIGVVASRAIASERAQTGARGRRKKPAPAAPPFEQRPPSS